MNAKICVMALLCHFLSSLAYAQALKVGDKIPDELWELPLQVVNHPEGRDTIRLGEYKDKLIILDFWATWCAPCVKSLSKLDSIQKEFNGKLTILPISKEAKEKVLTVILKRGWQLTSIIQDSILANKFPHLGIPHQVWIKDKQIFAITGTNYNNSFNINNILSGKDIKMIMKEDDIDFVPENFLIPRSDEWFISGLKKRVNANIGGMRVNKYGLIYYNTTVEFMFRDILRRQYPFLTTKNRVVYETPDSTTYQIKQPPLPLSGTFKEDSTYQEWLQNNTYIYYLRFSEPQSRGDLYNKMFRDISNYFEINKGISVSIEKRIIPCYVLRMTKRKVDPVVKNDASYVLANKPFKNFYSDLLIHTDYQPYPIIDETGISGNYTIKLHTELSDITNLQRELPTYGIELEFTTRELEVLVFKQKKS